MENNVLQRFSQDWRQFDEIEPAKGTRAWIRGTLDGWPGAFDIFEEKKEISLSEEDIKLIRAEFHTHAPAANDHEWGFWCGVIADLARLEIKDPKAVELIAKRATDPQLPHHQTLLVLKMYKRPELPPFVHQRIRFLMNDSESAKRHRDEFHNLLANLKSENAASALLLRDALQHEDDKLRSDAAYFVKKLPDEVASGFLRVLLADPSRDVRRNAILNIQHLCTIKDKPWLDKLLASEEDERNRELMEEKIRQLK